jgi:hypothetical protein
MRLTHKWVGYCAADRLKSFPQLPGAVPARPAEEANAALCASFGWEPPPIARDTGRGMPRLFALLIHTVERLGEPLE